MNEHIKVALIGHPVSHSKSPLMHNFWIRQYGLAGEYSAIDVRPGHLEGAIKQCVKQGFSGLQFTIPHKEEALELCDEVDSVAKAVGAVNTIVIHKNKLYGFNTDVFGFTENITECEPNFEFNEGPAVVLGAGGAAHGIVYALIEQKCPEIRLTNRTLERAQELAKKFGPKIKVFPWEERSQILEGAHLLVNTTSLGLTGQSPLDLDLSYLDPKTIVNDIIYAPLYTKLLRQAESHGNHVVNGIGMLVHQGRPAFKRWFGIMPTADMELMQMLRK
jgi:shikimate dehydrogenase